MYHVNGAFGQVRMATITPVMQKKGVFSLVRSVGTNAMICITLNGQTGYRHICC